MTQYIIITVILISPFFFIGIINKVKAIWAGRKGASILQPYFDFWKLLKKGEVISRTTSFVFLIAPSINVAAVILALIVVPIPNYGSIISFPGDFVFFTYILGFAKFFTVLAALDTGSSFEGMGASREAAYTTIVEPAFFIIIGSLALLSGNTSFETLFASLNGNVVYNLLVQILFVLSLFIMLLTEGSRVPVDDPTTHLELTMIHEVMVLDYSGPDLAYIFYAAGLKMVIIAILIANLLIQEVQNFSLLFITFFGIITIIFICVGIVESLVARARISHVPQFIFIMMALAIISFAVISFFIRGGF